MKKLTRKLFISVLVAVFAFVALGTSTYAWITMSTTAEVTAFDVSVDAGAAGIELTEVYDPAKPTESTWVSVLTLQSVPTTKLNDLTSEDGTTFYDFTSGDYTGPDTDKYTSEMKQAGTKATSGWFEKEIWIRRSGETTGTTKVIVDGAKVVFDSGAEVGTASYTPTGKNSAVSATTILASNCARLSVEGNTGTAIYQQDGEALAADTDSYAKNTLGYSEFGFAHKYAENQGIYLDDAGIYDAVNNALKAGKDNSTEIITLTDSTPVKLTIRVWIEGWDNECHANVLNQSFSIAFGFRQTSAENN